MNEGESDTQIRPMTAASLLGRSTTPYVCI
jgi:hypothetical protein